MAMTQVRNISESGRKPTEVRSQFNSLDSLCQLTSIEFNFYQFTLDRLSKTIARLPPSIEEISLFLSRFPHGDQLSRPETWSQLDRTLVRAKLAAPRNFKIEFWYQGKGMKELFTQLLPLFSKRLILTIEFQS
jgi:hypothetical protein